MSLAYCYQCPGIWSVNNVPRLLLPVSRDLECKQCPSPIATSVLNEKKRNSSRMKDETREDEMTFQPDLARFFLDEFP